MDSNSIDSVVTDPPYGLSKEPDIVEVLTKWLNGEPYDHGHGGFMGKSWDSFVPHPDIWREVYRVLKPGGHALVFAGTRTQDLMTISLRLAGFEVRDVIEWLYASGFPKSMDVSKAFDKRAGVERKKIGERTKLESFQYKGNNVYQTGGDKDRVVIDITVPATELAKKWDGWGTALKPAHEPIIVVRKPLEGTVCDNVEKYGTGAINIDACRIPTEDETRRTVGGFISKSGIYHNDEKYAINTMETNEPKGRFPANCITLESDAFYSKYFNISPPELSKKASKKDRNSDWRGEEIALEPKFTRTMGDGIGVREHNPSQKSAYNSNHHPTVKPTDLMAWLVRLSTPPGGTVLDPFAGSGSTLVAAKREGFNFVGIELEEEYIPIIEARTGIKAI